MSSRKENSSKSLGLTLIYSIVKLLTQFLFRSIFILYLSIEYLGINSAIAGVINLLAVSELGFSTVVLFSLYKPVSENDIPTINSIIKFYKKVYFIVGCVLMILGLALIPFLDKLVTVSNDVNVNLTLVYVLSLFASVISYLFSYRIVLYTAYQQLYIQSVVNIITTIVNTILQICIIIIFRNYYIYLITLIVSNFISYLSLHLCSIKSYPQIKEKNAQKLNENVSAEIKLNLKGIVYHKFSAVILQASDSLVISAFIGTLLLGIYSNYTIFITNLQAFFLVLSGSLMGSIGNLLVENDRDKSYRIFQDLKLVFFFLAGFCSICLFVLLNPAIKLWSKLGGWDPSVNWTMDIFTVLIIVLNFFIFTSRIITGTFRECIGNFDKDRIKGIVEAIINLVVSILLVKPLGIAGVLIGTIVSCLCTSIWVDPYMVYKYQFKKPLWKHFRDIVFYLVVTVISGGLVYFVCSFLPDGDVLQFLLKFFVCITMSFLLLFLAYFKTPMFKDLKLMLKPMFSKFKKRKGDLTKILDDVKNKTE